MRDVSDSNYQDNKRALSVIFSLENIGKDWNSADFSELSINEKPPSYVQWTN